MAKARKGMMILETMPSRMQRTAGKKRCTVHDEVYDTFCKACKREYSREHYRKRKDPFA